jgi:uncharacterized protein (DUF1919 family)
MPLIDDIKERARSIMAVHAKQRFYFDCKSFPTIISNDCYGGEIYRSLGAQYNTPFIGLMIMAPCYIKLLKSLEFYLSKELQFIKQSKYEAVNNLLSRKGYFPIASLNNEIEIQFLHYQDENEANEKWKKRKKRMDLNNLFLKFDYSKDYANELLLQEFLNLNYKKKLAIGSDKRYNNFFHENLINIPEYSTDGVIFFRLSLKYIDYEYLLSKNILRKPSRIDGFIFSKFLRNK